MADNERLIALKEAEMAAAAALTFWSVANTYGKTAAELVEVEIGHGRARREWLRACAAYAAALQEAVDE